MFNIWNEHCWVNNIMSLLFLPSPRFESSQTKYSDWCIYVHICTWGKLNLNLELFGSRGVYERGTQQSAYHIWTTAALLLWFWFLNGYTKYIGWFAKRYSSDIYLTKMFPDIFTINILPYIFVGISERPSQENISESGFEMLRCHLELWSLIGCNISAPKSSL